MSEVSRRTFAVGSECLKHRCVLFVCRSRALIAEKGRVENVAHDSGNLHFRGGCVTIPLLPCPLSSRHGYNSHRRPFPWEIGRSLSVNGAVAAVSRFH